MVYFWSGAWKWHFLYSCSCLLCTCNGYTWPHNPVFIKFSKCSFKHSQDPGCKSCTFVTMQGRFEERCYPYAIFNSSTGEPKFPLYNLCMFLYLHVSRLHFLKFRFSSQIPFHTSMLFKSSWNFSHHICF